MTFCDEMMTILSIDDNCQNVDDKIKILMNFSDVDDESWHFLMIYVRIESDKIL